MIKILSKKIFNAKFRLVSKRKIAWFALTAPIKCTELISNYDILINKTFLIVTDMEGIIWIVSSKPNIFMFYIVNNPEIFELNCIP